MSEYLAALLGLGVAGFDPIGALLIAGALAAGASRRSVLAFAGSCLLVTVVLGAGLSVALGPLMGGLAAVWQLEDGWWLAIDVTVAAALLAWGIRRIRNRSGRRSGTDSPRPVRGVGIAAMTISGALWGMAAATDPTFYASALLAGRRDVLPMIVGIALWYAVSQLPLHVLTGAVLAGKHHRAVQWLRQMTERWAGPVRRIITVLIFAGAALLVADAAVFVVTDDFLIG